MVCHIKHRVVEIIYCRIIQNILLGVTEIGGACALNAYAELSNYDVASKNKLLLSCVLWSIRPTGAVRSVAGKVYAFAILGRILSAE